MQRQPAPQKTQKRRSVWLILLLAILFILLASAVAARSLKATDLKITDIIQTLKNPFLTKATAAICWFGNAPQCFLIIFLSGLALFCRRYRWEAVVLVVSPLLAIGLDMLIKIIVRYPGPMVPQGTAVIPLNYYTFPSGQVLLYMTFFGFLNHLIAAQMKGSWKRTGFLLLLGFLILSDGFCKIYLLKHWPSDVIGGYILGGMLLLIAIQVYKYGINRNIKLSRRK